MHRTPAHVSLIRLGTCGVLAVALLSCAALGTSVHFTKPEAIPAIKRVVLWPIAAIPLADKFDQRYPEIIGDLLERDSNFVRASVNWSLYADSLLAYEVDQRGLFSIVPLDSVSSIPANPERRTWRFVHADFREFIGPIDADGVLTATLWFKKEMGGINTYIELVLYDQPSGAEVVKVGFNTQWGKSYLFSHGAAKTLPDAMHGAVAGLAKALKENAIRMAAQTTK
jgi:hypothetical protein